MHGNAQLRGPALFAALAALILVFAPTAIIMYRVWQTGPQ